MVLVQICVIENMYNNVSYRIKLPGGITTPITSNVGVKQGCVLSPLLFNIFLSDLPCIFDSSCSPVTLYDSKLSCLMFADDIVIFSESVNGLQNALNKLQSYCNDWQLSINVNKTKIIIFNKGGRSISKNKFFYGLDEVNIVQSYCYLGIIFSTSGNFNLALQNLRDKALKAFHHFRQFDLRNNIHLALKLFDTLVTPILNYGCEAWAPFAFKNLKDSNFLHLCNNSIIESINIKFCKYLLGVHRKSSNLAVLGELGRFPLILNSFSHCFNNWLRITNLSPDSIVKKSYIDCLLWDTAKSNTWCGNFHSLLQSLDMNLIWEHQGSSSYKTSIKSSIQTKYEQDWLTTINSDLQRKLRTYKTFKTSFKMENYILSQKLEKRKYFTKLRISSHNLHIETGRYNRPKTAPNDRICALCNSGDIEDEFHFMLKCTLYDQERSDLFTQLQDFSTLNFLHKPELFLTLMTANYGDHEFASSITNFIHSCYEKRQGAVNLQPPL